MDRELTTILPCLGSQFWIGKLQELGYEKLAKKAVVPHMEDCEGFSPVKQALTVCQFQKDKSSTLRPKNWVIVYPEIIHLRPYS